MRESNFAAVDPSKGSDGFPEPAFPSVRIAIQTSRLFSTPGEPSAGTSLAKDPPPQAKNSRRKEKTGERCFITGDNGVGMGGKDAGLKSKFPTREEKPLNGFEPLTRSLRMSCSTTELKRR